jgi:hypothetical protein
LKWLDRHFNQYQAQNFDAYFGFAIEAILENLKDKYTITSEVFQDSELAVQLKSRITNESVADVKLLYAIQTGLDLFDDESKSIEFSWEFDFPFLFKEFRDLRMGNPISDVLHSSIYCVFLEKRALSEADRRLSFEKDSIQSLITFRDTEQPDHFYWQLSHSEWLFSNIEMKWKLLEVPFFEPVILKD